MDNVKELYEKSTFGVFRRVSFEERDYERIKLYSKYFREGDHFHLDSPQLVEEGIFKVTMLSTKWENDTLVAEVKLSEVYGEKKE